MRAGPIDAHANVTAPGARTQRRARWRVRLAALVLAAAGVVGGALPAQAGGVDGVVVDEELPTATTSFARFLHEKGLSGRIAVRDGHVAHLFFPRILGPWPTSAEPDPADGMVVEASPLSDEPGGTWQPTTAGLELGDGFVLMDLRAMLTGMGGSPTDHPPAVRITLRTGPGAAQAVDVEADVLLPDQPDATLWTFDVRRDPSASVRLVYDTDPVRGSAGTTVRISQLVPTWRAPLFSGIGSGGVTATWTAAGSTVPVAVPVAGTDEMRASVRLPSGTAGPGVLELRDTVFDGPGHTVRVPVLPPVADPVEAYVTAVYEDLLLRQPDAGGLAHWSGALRAGTPYGEVANAVTGSPEFRTRLIVGAYGAYLGRAPDPSGLQHWLTQMGRGLQIEQLEAGFLASQEYYLAAGGYDEEWVYALYEEVLGRTPGDDEVEHWVDVSVRAGRPAVAEGFLYSTEHLTTVVDDYYGTLLHRSIDPSGRNTWVGAIQAGHRDEEIVASILSSAEYRANVPRP